MDKGKIMTTITILDELTTSPEVKVAIATLTSAIEKAIEKKLHLSHITFNDIIEGESVLLARKAEALRELMGVSPYVMRDSDRCDRFHAILACKNQAELDDIII